MKKNSDFIVVCDETNNSEQDRLDGKMNVDLYISPSYEDFEKFLDKTRREIAESVGVKLPEENDGGIGQGKL